MLLCPLFLSVVLGADPASERLVVENDRVSVVLSSHGAVIEAVDRKSGRTLCTASPQRPLFRFDYSGHDEPGAKIKTCHAGQAEQVRLEPWSRGSDRGARVTFAGFQGRPITVVCSVFTRLGDPLVHFRLEADLPPDVTLEGVSYPTVAVGPPTATDDHRVAVAGSTKGGIHGLSAWKEGDIRHFEQPGSLAAGFACCYDDRGGVYTAAYDSQGHRKALSLRRTSSGLEWSWHHPCFARQRFALAYDVVLGGFASPEADRATDWRDAADIYKAWAIKQPWCFKTFAQRDDLPEWLKQGPAIVRFTRAWLADPTSVEAWYREYWRKEFPAATPLITAYWGWEKNGKWVGPEYFPAYPSDDQFRRLVRLGWDINAHTFLWPSGYNCSLS